MPGLVRIIPCYPVSPPSKGMALLAALTRLFLQLSKNRKKNMQYLHFSFHVEGLIYGNYIFGTKVLLNKWEFCIKNVLFLQRVSWKWYCYIQFAKWKIKIKLNIFSVWSLANRTHLVEKVMKITVIYISQYIENY